MSSHTWFRSTGVWGARTSAPTLAEPTSPSVPREPGGGEKRCRLFSVVPATPRSRLWAQLLQFGSTLEGDSSPGVPWPRTQGMS